MATLFLICGLPGSGKTTLAKRLEGEWSALRLTANEWLFELFPAYSDEELDATRDPVERLQWRTALRILETGGNVVLDWGLYAREERDQYRSEAQAVGAQVVLCVLDLPMDELRARIAKRNADLPPGTYLITESVLDTALHCFQPPTPDELAAFDPFPGTPAQQTP
ncbi:AAA family ATPase [Streptomyces sp. NBC_00654]|uniref:AAA family ATPase n=1 Tax=Streptomyces sp. NBC_00654 TaxID=2975799 RepID=UPI002251E3D8|nr:AAA family ATPase [Streptomyces sp. NBC_00654]MCX4968031.1 AAA family ATPase [Streptomyces sp. NBC_00654]